MTLRVRLADPAVDAAAVAAIYLPVVEHSHSSFETEPPTAGDMAERIRETLQRTPWLVAEAETGAVGYAYAAPHRMPAAYRWSVNLSVYVAESARGMGLGRMLYDSLLPILQRQRFVNAYAGIALPNPASEALHRSVGMSLVGVYRDVGYKHGRWWDVAWYGMRLVEPTGSPDEPVPLPELGEVPLP